MRRPRVLFTSPVMRHPPIGGPYLRIENTLKALARISDVWVVCMTAFHALGGEAAVSFYRQHCREFLFAPSLDPQAPLIPRQLRRAVNYFSRLTFGRNWLPGGHDSARDRRALLAVADRIDAQVIWLGYGNISYPLLRHIKSHSSYPVVLDTDSVWSRFILRGLPFAADDQSRSRIEREGQEKREEERWGTQCADITTAVSEVDAAYYRDLARNPDQVRLFPNVIDLGSYERVPPAASELRRPCIFLGGSFMRASPMEDAARWFLELVLPRVRAQLPSVLLHIVGAGADVILRDVVDPSVAVTGQVPSVLPYLCHADVAVVPLRFESGTRFKILEAAACGTPVVSTTLGAEGLNVTHGQQLLVADEPSDFAAAIIRLIRDRKYAEQLSARARARVIEEYDLEALVRHGREILRSLQSPAASGSDAGCGASPTAAGSW